jgi:hypothetical protein
MTEQVPTDPQPERSQADPDTPATPSPDRVRTGVSAVDRVVDEIEGLDEVPLEEHLSAFERAHASLRAALDDVSARGVGDQPGQPA